MQDCFKPSFSNSVWLFMRKSHLNIFKEQIKDFIMSAFISFYFFQLFETCKMSMQRMLHVKFDSIESILRSVAFFTN